MLDIKWIRENPEKVKKALKDRGADFDLELLLELDRKRRAKIKEADDLRSRANRLSEEVPGLSGGEKEEKLGEAKTLKEELAEAGETLKSLESEFGGLMHRLPNIPADNVPVGKDESANKILREEGRKPKFDFEPKDYMELARNLDLIDTERAAKVSGSRFGYLKNEAALLEFALINFAMDELRSRGFSLVIPPVLIREEMMRGMGYIDSEKDSEERYFIEKDKLYLVGTSEQSVGPMHAGEIFAEADLPKRYAAFSTCFRREAGSYGKDTHGILRVHQFDKVEMFSFTKPEDSKKEHGLLLKTEEDLMRALGLPYQVVALSTGDLSQPSASTYDIEAWLPGQNQYRETHSTSNTTDFQARRLNIRYRPAAPSHRPTTYVHTLNGTAFAIGRMIIAILENYQRGDGSVEIPEILRKYMGGSEVIGK